MRASPLALISARVRTSLLDAARCCGDQCQVAGQPPPSATPTAQSYQQQLAQLKLRTGLAQFMSVLSCYTTSYTCINPQGGHRDGPSNGQTIDAAVTVEMDCKKDKISK